MKIAKLADGKELFFPPDMDDAEMDRRVMEHVQGGAQMAPAAADPAQQMMPQGGQMAGLMPLMQIIQQFMADQQAQAAAAQEATAQDQQAQREQDVSMRREEVQAQLQVTQQAAAGVQGAIDALRSDITGLNQTVGQLAGNAEQMSEVVKAVNNLSQTIVETGSVLAKVMRASKELVRDENGTPIGVRVKS